MGPGFESPKAHQWPVGQAVKTAASHAANMGSIPVRVTRIGHHESGVFFYFGEPYEESHPVAQPLGSHTAERYPA